MCTSEKLRFELHERLLALDSANVELMKLVMLDKVGGGDWGDAVTVLRSNIADLELTLAEEGALPEGCSGTGSSQ